MARIFVIDDSAVVLEIAEALLSEAGHDVTTFTSGKHAIQTLTRQSPDLIITDIYMPDEDGLDVIRNVRRMYAHTPIVAMSGMTGRMNMLTVAQHLGASCTLLKPFSRAELLGAVSSALAGASSDGCQRE